MNKKKKKEFNFNQALEELKKITAEFEAGNLDLDRALEKLKRGLELAKICKEKLRQVENEVVIIKKKFAQVEQEPEEFPENGD